MTLTHRRPFPVAVELTAAGRHPAAWRLNPTDPFAAQHWVRLARAAEAAGAALVILDDSAAPPVERPGALVGSLDAVGVAALLGPLTERVGLAPVVPVTYREPFHVGKEIQTIDHVSLGRGAVQVDGAAPADASSAGAEALRYDERVPRDLAALWREADDVLEVLGRLWDSWEDDAIVLDAETDRYIDRDRVHAIEFEGEFFSVQGASITPRSPQGRPVVILRGDEPHARAVAARRADIVRVADEATVPLVRAAAADEGREVIVLLDVDVLLGTTDDDARARHEALDALEPWATDAVVAGTGTAAAVLQDLVDRSGADGLTLRPLALATDLPLLGQVLAPAAPGTTLRDSLGLPRPASRYAAAR
ncbi:LLM class flavin-dependent oxidoreductase [Cellulomonas sp. ICMP 17802]|uniref:LLM class flavin-dependent oxidoreductase n=1 Tax=Cellulomonas sp. ICMP 17802 TaxID=3239199 RepID=UPI00351B14CD